MRIALGLLGVVSLLLMGQSGAAIADTKGDKKIVGNVVIYMGLLPAEMIRGYPADHPEASMHGGAPKGVGAYHVVFALFSAKTGQRITNADVTARVNEMGLAGEEKNLEPMEIAGTETYGNYFPMIGAGPFRITLTIHLPGDPGELRAVFEHKHK